MILARAPKKAVADRAAYEFFAGLNSDAEPVWSEDVSRREAVFTHAACCLRSGVTYNAPLRRYLWWQQIPKAPYADTRFDGGLGVYDAPEPWGPWTAAYYTECWDVGPGETGSFPTKWMSADGRTVHLVFSPPFARMPELTCEAVDGPPARIKAAVFCHGARLEAKRRNDVATTARLRIGFVARTAAAQVDAA